MKALFLNILAIVFSVAVKAQVPELVWAKHIGGNADIFCEASAVAADDEGNIYATGWFSKTVDFDPGPGIFTLTSKAQQDLFLIKLDTAGKLLWAKQISDNANGTAFSRPASLIIDKNQDIVFTGIFYGTVDFDPGPGVYNLTVPHAAGTDIFICKIARDGSFIWARHLVGTKDFNSPFSIISDSHNNVYVSGEFRYTVDFDPGPAVYNLTCSDFRNGFVLKLNENGNFQWARNILKGPGSFNASISMDIDLADNVYVSGSFSGTTDFDPGPNNQSLTATGQIDLFISKLNSYGDFAWVKRIGGNDKVECSSIALDGSGDIYISGSYHGTADFDPGPGVNTMSAFGAQFLAKLDKNGNFIWAKEMVSDQNIFGGINGVFIDDADNVFLAGIFNGAADFDPSPKDYFITAKNNIDYFFTKLTSSGDFQYTGHIETFWGNGNWRPLPLAFYRNYIYVLGDFQHTGDVDPGPGSLKLSATGYSDIFILKLRQDREITLGPDTTACKGDTFVIIPKGVYTGDKVKWNTGDTTLTLAVTKSGIYSIEVQIDNISFYDTISVTFLPKPTVYIGPDTAFCDIVDHLLQPKSNASHFLWNTGDTTKDLHINKDGTYSLLVKSSQMCENADTVKIDKINSPFGFASKDTSVCGDKAILDARNAGNSYLWSTGEKTQKIEVTQSGWYSVTISNGFCTTTDSIHVTLVPRIDCAPRLFLPNSFSPNHDGLNETFLASGIAIESFHITIYNRWGEKLFESRDISMGWDGNYHNAPAGVYVYLIEYSFEDNGLLERKFLKGTVQLVR